MNPIETIHLHELEFTKSEHIIKNFVLQNPAIIACHPLVFVANEMNVSKSVLSRFCQKCGYNGFTEFKYEISRFLHSGKFFEKQRLTSFDDIFTILSTAMNTMHSNISEDHLTKFAKDVIQARRIRILGIHESGLPAHHLLYRLTTLGIDAEVLEIAIASEKANLSNKDDLFIIFSLSSTTPEIVEVVDNALARQCKVAVISQNDHCHYRNEIAHFIQIPTLYTNQNQMFIDAQYLNFIMIEFMIHIISSLS